MTENKRVEMAHETCVPLTSDELRQIEGGTTLAVSTLINPAIVQTQTMQYILQKYGWY